MRLLDAIDGNSPPELTATFADMTLAAWEIALLSGRAASVVRQVHDQQPYLRAQTAAFCATCSSLRPQQPERAAEVNACISAGDLDSAKKLTELYAAQEPGNLFWLRFATFLGIQLGELDWYEPWLAAPPMPDAFTAAFRADYAFARMDWGRAAALYATAHAQTGLTEWLAREGECHRKAENRDAARACWQKAAGLRPWQINLLLRLHDLANENDLPGSLPTGKGEILLYSWNHADDLDKAMAALAASTMGDSGLTVLDNGSTDATADVVRSWQNRFGERLRTITLPTNIGAPAARNWLLSLEHAQTADWVVFLDDDALVPPDWLGYFGTALKRHPDAGIIGCRVVDMAAPLTIQSVDLHFEADVDPQTKERGIVDTHTAGPDFGQYSYLRPAVSVTGLCCPHLGECLL